MDGVNQAIEDIRREVGRMKEKYDKLDYILATVITNLKHQPDKVPEILAWYAEQVRS